MQHVVDYKEVPPDFPHVPTESLEERWFSWSVCDEVVTHMCKECRTLRAHAYPGERDVDILYKLFIQAREKGWGTDEELRFIFRHVAARLGWNAPHAVRRA